MNDKTSRASTRLAPATGTANTAQPVAPPCRPEALGLTQDEIRQIVIDLIG